MQVSYHFLGLLFILAAVLSCGCILQSPDRPASLAPVQETPRVTSGDPIVGTWHWNTFDGSKTIFYTFTADGTYATSDSMNTGTEKGTWTPAGENRYNVTIKDNLVVFLYQPETDTIAKANYPTTRLYPEGKGPAIITHGAKAPLQTPEPTTRVTLDLVKELSGGALSSGNMDPEKIVKSVPPT